jgi:hypothetical protein
LGLTPLKTKSAVANIKNWDKIDKSNYFDQGPSDASGPIRVIKGKKEAFELGSVEDLNSAIKKPSDLMRDGFNQGFNARNKFLPFRPGA